LSVKGGQSPLLDSLSNNSDFNLVYSSAPVKIFHVIDAAK
jgi:hypothetical protein